MNPFLKSNWPQWALDVYYWVSGVIGKMLSKMFDRDHDDGLMEMWPVGTHVGMSINNEVGWIYGTVVEVDSIKRRYLVQFPDGKQWVAAGQLVKQ